MLALRYHQISSPPGSRPASAAPAQMCASASSTFSGDAPLSMITPSPSSPARRSAFGPDA